MSPAYATAEQYQRWHVRTCARCGRTAGLSANWPDGPICRTCYAQATRTHGPCPGCQIDRLLPGRDTHGHPICRACAGITRNFTCTRCHDEGYLRAGLCRRCTFTDELTVILDDGTGRIHPPLVGLFDQLRAMTRPASGLDWIGKPQPRALLADLASGDLPLTHEAFDALPNWRTAAYLRDLLMQCGALPPADRQLLLFKRWLGEYLAGVPDPEQAAALTRFATWNQLRALRTKAAKAPVSAGRASQARRRISQAGTFLAWLAERNIPLPQCRQTDLDDFGAEQPVCSREIRPFLLWSVRTTQMPALKIPVHLPTTAAPAPMPQTTRIAEIRSLACDESLELRTRVAGLIVLLYAQPVSRLVRLTIDDIVTTSEQTTLNLGDPPTPVPEPLRALLRKYLSERPNMTTATNSNSRWLFPGRRAGQPLHPSTICKTLDDIGITTVRSRTAAIRALVLQMPPPVVAQALSYHQASTARIAAEAGNAWAGYAPGDHGPHTTRGPAE